MPTLNQEKIKRASIALLTMGFLPSTAWAPDSFNLSTSESVVVYFLLSLPILTLVALAYVRKVSLAIVIGICTLIFLVIAPAVSDISAVTSFGLFIAAYLCPPIYALYLFFDKWLARKSSRSLLERTSDHNATNDQIE